MNIGVSIPFYDGSPVGMNVVAEHVIAGLSTRRRLCIYTSVPAAFRHLDVRLRPLPERTQRFQPRLLWQWLVLPRLVRRDGLDLVLFLAPENALLPGIPSIAFIHDLTPLVIPECTPLRHVLLFRLTLRTLNHATALATGSEHTRSDLRKSGRFTNRDIQVIPHGSDFSETEAEPLADEPFLLYVGGYLPHKNVALLLDAFHDVAPEFPHRLLLAGQAPDSIRSRIPELNLTDRVRILGAVTRTELLRLYARCALMVYPSRYEGFGLPVLEAMSCGAPVLSSSAASLPEVGGDAVAYFSPDSRVELAAGIRHLLTHPDQRRRLAQQGRERAGQFSWARTVAAYDALIERTIAAHPGRI